MSLLGSLIGVGASLLGGKMGSDAAGDAAAAQAEAAKYGADIQKEMYDTTRADMLPYMGRGYQGLDLYAMNLGLMPPGSQYTAPGFSYVNPDGTVIGPDNPPQGYFPQYGQTGNLAQQAFQDPSQARYGHFYSTPTYSMPYNAGLDYIDSSAAMRGMNLDQGQAEGAANYGAGMASQRWKDYMNMLANLSGLGQTGASSMAGYGTQAGSNLANQAMAAGDARASGYIGANNAWANTANQIGTIAGNYFS